MNQCIKNGLIVALPCLFIIPFVWGICGVLYLLDSTRFMFIWDWAILFIFLFLAIALLGFIIGVMEQQDKKNNKENIT